jgi:uncharacterized protein YggE
MRTWWVMGAMTLSALVAITLPGVRPLQAQTVSPGVGGAVNAGLTVVGDGQVSAVPDAAWVNLGVQTDGETAQAAIEANGAAMAAVIRAVREQGVPETDIRTAAVNLTPITARNRPGEETPPTVVGYRASNTITVSLTDVAKAGAVLDAGIAAGANLAGGLRFGFQDETALRRQALEQAAANARAKAESLAAALGLRLTGIAAVEEEPSGPVPVARATASEAAQSVPVQPGELTVQARVRVVFTYE